MFIALGDGVLNLKRVTTIEIDRDTPSEINYLFNDGGIVKEEFANSEIALTRFTVLADINLFIATNDNRLINSMYIKNIEQDLLNDKKLIYVLYNGAPVKEVYDSADEVVAAIETLKVTLESIGDTTEDETTIDLTPYLKKLEASATYATIDALNKGLDTKADITTIPDVTGFATIEALATKAEKKYVDEELVKKANVSDIPEIPDTTDFVTTEQLAEKADIGAVPTKTSQLENDSDFVTGTDLQSLGAQFSTQMQEMNTQNSQAHSNLQEQISNKADISDIPEVPDVTGFATTEQLAEKADISAIPTETSQLTNNSDFTTNAYVNEQLQSLAQEMTDNFVSLTTYNELVARVDELQALIESNHPQA